MNQDETSPESPAGQCTSCGAQLPLGTRFCPECGAEATTGATCPSCGEQVQAGERFCRYCGTQVAAFMSGRSPWPDAFQAEADVQPPADSGETPSDQAPYSPQPEDDLRRATQSPASAYRTFDPSGITCPRCGAQADAYDSFCNSCGLPFDEQETSEPDRALDLVYGPLLIRFVARLIDAFILIAVFVVLFFVTGTDTYFEVDGDVAYPTTMFYVVAIAIQFVYHAGFVSLWRATPGKRVMGLRVEPVTGSFLGLAKPSVRESVIQAPSLLSFTPYDETGSIVSLVIIIASVLIALSRPDRRMIHDLVAGTMVVRERT